MFDYKRYFEQYCEENGLNLNLSLTMQEGYETANASFDFESKTIFINAEYLKTFPDYEKAFYLFHELRHSSQYLRPQLFNNTIRKSIQYVIMYDGTCYKIFNGKYYECKLEGGENYFKNIYLGQPYEVDANTYAYESVKKIFGDSDGLRQVLEFWMPSEPVAEQVYDSIYKLIDERISI